MGSGGKSRAPARSVSSERLAALSLHLRDVVWLVDRDGHVFFVSPSVKRVLGYTAGEFAAMDVTAFAHPDDVETVFASALAVAEPGGTSRFEARVRHGDGSWRWVETDVVNLLDDPEVGGVLCVVRDVTDRHSAEEALRASGAWFRAMVQESPDGCVIIDTETRVSYVSPAAERITGYKLEELEGDGIRFVHPDDVVTAAMDLGASLERPGVPVVGEVRIVRADGELRWIEAIGTNLLDDPDVAGIVVNFRDITDRKTAEAALRSSEERFRLLVQDASDVVQISDENGVITWMSPAVTAVLGYDPAELVGRQGVELCHPGDLARFRDSLAEALATPGGRGRVRWRVRHRDGSWRFVDALLSNHLHNPSIGGIVADFRDITDELAAARQTTQLTDIVEATSDLVVVTAADGRTVYMNAAARAFFNLPPDVPVATFDASANVPQWVIQRFNDEGAPALEADRVWSAELAWIRRGTEVPVSALVLGHRDATGAIDLVSTVTRDISERKAFEAQLRHQATHDPLTGLPNRTLLLDRLEVALARAERDRNVVGVLFCDLDHFKFVNDSLGHGSGDALLVAVAHRLRSLVRPGDTVARFGGDEFVVLCDDVASDRHAIALAQRLQEAMRQPFNVAGTEVFVTLSSGIARGGAGTSADALHPGRGHGDVPRQGRGPQPLGGVRRPPPAPGS